MRMIEQLNINQIIDQSNEIFQVSFTCKSFAGYQFQSFEQFDKVYAELNQFHRATVADLLQVSKPNFIQF